MLRRRIVLSLAVGALVVSAAWADDEEKSPLAKIMKKIDADFKSVRDATSTNAKFKNSGKGKKIIPTAKSLAALGKETRPFKDPSVKMKKPYDKWTDLVDRYLTATDDLIAAAQKGNLDGSRKAIAALNNSCSNCHGAFRPQVDDGF